MKHICFVLLIISKLSVGIPSFGADVFYETFESGIPDSWAITDNSDGRCAVWQGNDVGIRKNLTGGAGGYAMVDSDREGCADVELMTPSFEVPLNAYLTFDTDYNHINDMAKVDITTDGGQTWTSLLLWEKDHRGPVKTDLDLSAYAGETVQIRFVNVSGQDRWWQIDNVRLEFPDEDGDTIEDSVDNCPNDINGDQADADSDGFGDACTSSAPIVGCVNCTISKVTSPGLPAGAPVNFKVNETVSFTATNVTNSADISIDFASLPSRPYFYKITNGKWVQIYPANNSSGIRNVFLKKNTLKYTITDNASADEDPVLGRIKDPVAAGYFKSGIIIDSSSCFISAMP